MQATTVVFHVLCLSDSVAMGAAGKKYLFPSPKSPMMNQIMNSPKFFQGNQCIS